MIILKSKFIEIQWYASITEQFYINKLLKFKWIHSVPKNHRMCKLNLIYPVQKCCTIHMIYNIIKSSYVKKAEFSYSLITSMFTLGVRH